MLCSTGRWFRSKASNKNNTRLVCFVGFFFFFFCTWPAVHTEHNLAITECTIKVCWIPDRNRAESDFNSPTQVTLVSRDIKLCHKDAKNGTLSIGHLWWYDKRLQLLFLWHWCPFPVSKYSKELISRKQTELLLKLSHTIKWSFWITALDTPHMPQGVNYNHFGSHLQTRDHKYSDTLN